MKQLDSSIVRAALLGCTLLAALGSAGAQSQQPSNDDSTVPAATASQQAREIARGDPARWYRADATPAQRLRTLQKEIGAALQQAQLACRKLPGAERASCMQEARATYQQDMAEARAQVAAGQP